MGRRRTWTDDDLRRALDGARSMADVVARLRLSRGGAAYVTVRTRMEQLDLSLPDTTVSSAPCVDRGGRRGWSEHQLRAAVAAGRSLRDVFRHLELTVGGSQWLVIRSLILARGWSTAHWDRPLGREPRSWPDERRPFREVVAEADLASIVARSRSRAEVIRRLGHTPSSSTYRVLRLAMQEQGLSVAHFQEPYAAMRRSERARYRIPLKDILVAGSTYTNIGVLKQRLVEEGLLEPVCAQCGIDSWQGRLLTLHLDHVNGVRNDHRIENLRLLCPNCHSQTGTFAGRNKGRYESGTRRGSDERLR